MRLAIILSAAALLTLTLSVPASAQANEITNPIKWVQWPDLQNGRDLQSQYDITDNEPDVIKADDWICLDGLPITDYHWWGSYYNDEHFEVAGFYIAIYANDDGDLVGDPSDDMPGEWLKGIHTTGNANETFYAVDGIGETVYEYSLDLTDLGTDYWFYQEQGEKYWISFVADTPDIGQTPVWGWHTGLEPAGIGGLTDAVTGKVIVGNTWAVGNPDEWGRIDYNMAFALTTIPEPGTLALLGFGVASLLVARRKKR